MFSPSEGTVKPSVYDSMPPESSTVVVGAEAARVEGLQRPTIVGRREAVDGVRVPSCVEQLRAAAVTVVPHC